MYSKSALLLHHNNKQVLDNILYIFCSTLSEFDNVLLCELVRRNHQANFKDFKLFEVFVAYSTKKDSFSRLSLMILLLLVCNSCLFQQ
jgi:hypothetical protein